MATFVGEVIEVAEEFLAGDAAMRAPSSRAGVLPSSQDDVLPIGPTAEKTAVAVDGIVYEDID